MQSLTSDPLLAVARGAVLFSMAIVALIGLLFLMLAPVMVFGRLDILAEVSMAQGLTASGFLGIGAIMLLVASMAGCAFLFLRHLLRIIDSVGKGDPFNPVNAARLAAMGWLTLGVEAISVPAGLIGAWIASIVKEGGDVDIGIGLSPSGVLLAIVLFILARVFRQGADMRAELEGTV